MSNPSRVSTATEADWSYMEDDKAMDALTQAVRKVAREFEAVVELEDARQDALLWLAVRPERVARAQRDDDYGQLYQDIYANGLRPSAMIASGMHERTVSRDALEGFEL